MLNRRLRGCLLCIFLLAISLISGCSCWKDPLGQNGATPKSKRPATLEEMEARRRELQEKQEEKPDFETIRLAVLPTDDAPTRNQIKPGHWFNAVQTMKANAYDFPKGELESRCVDQKGEAIPLPETGFELSTSRSVNLPKGQQKHFDLLMFANPIAKGRGAINLMTRLRPRGGGREVEWKYEATTKMKAFQNHFVVLASRPDNYQFVKTLRSVKPQRTTDEYLNVELDYFVKLPKGTRRVDVPSHSMTWSSTAYVLWDDFEPEILNTDQQQALIDWLHWGGQIIVNGPRTLDRLQASSFAEYLPARADKVTTLSDEQIAELNDNWSFPDSNAKHLAEINDEKQRPVALELNLTDGSRFVPGTADLVAEKLVGRGRVVVTGFNLPHGYFLAWDSYDTFFNACLLGRPARRFFNQSGSIVEDWVGTGLARYDPRTTSSVRYFTRDAMSLTLQQNRPALMYGASLPGQLMPIAQPNLRDIEDVLAKRAAEEDRMPRGLPDFGINISGPASMAVGSEASFVITIKNNGNITQSGLTLEVHGDEVLQLTQGTEGFTDTERGVVLMWGVQNLRPGDSDRIEVVGLVESAADLSDASLAIRVVQGDGQVNKRHYVEIEPEGGIHNLDVVADTSFSVNGFAQDDVVGVAGWSDKSDVSREARESLRQSAGISVPSADFIARVLGIYLLILVPVNWVLFRVMGRVEWAWAAVPLIAIGGALGVVQAAQLDIGFARSRTEIAVVEMQPDYRRAHVTRYIGFYTSLSSDYRVTGENESTLAQPFAASQQGMDQEVALDQGADVSLTGFSVVSNSTGMIHGEQITDMGGAFQLSEDGGRTVLQNDTDYDLTGAAVVRRTLDGTVQIAWVGDLGKKQRKTDLDFQRLASVAVAFQDWESSPATSRRSVEGDLNIRRLMDIATDPKRLGRGEVVLVGWNDAVLPGISVRPDASQITSRVLFVAQLRHAERPNPKRDVNCFAVMDRAMTRRSDTPDL